MKTCIVHLKVDRKVLEKNNLFAAIEPVYWALNIDDGPEEYKRSLQGFSRSQRLILAVWWYRAEVNNGGHGQFYFNGTGVMWKDALDGLAALDLEQHASILRESARRFDGEPPLDTQARRNALESQRPCFDDLDRRFYKLAESTDLDFKMLDFVRRNLDDFAFEGAVERPLPPGTWTPETDIEA